MAVVMVSMHGIVLSHDRTLQEENGEYLNISQALAISLLNHMNSVKRKKITSTKIVPKNLPKYVIISRKLIKAVADHSIP